MFCTACGTKNQLNSNFCKQCGQALEKTTPAKISEADFDHALPIDEQVDALLERAYRLRKSGDLDGAVALCNEVLELRPTSTSAHSLLGQLYEAQGDKPRAIAALERVLEINPGSIADRVKLDELRGEAAPRTETAMSRPRIVLAERAGGPRETRPFALVAGACALMLIGGASALVIRNSAERHPAASQPSARPNPLATSAPATQSSIPAPAVSLPASEQKTGNGRQETGAAARNVAANAGNPTTNADAIENRKSKIQNPTAPVVVPPVVIDRTVYVDSNGRRLAPNLASRTSRTVPPMNVTFQRANDMTNSGDNDGRVLLPGDGNPVTNDGNGHYTIKIGEGDKTAAASSRSSNASNGKKPTPQKTGGDGNGTMRIKVTESPSSKAVGNPNNVDSAPPVRTTGGEAQTMIARGRDLMQQADYARAIQAYRSALTTAGDAEGMVYQQIGLCYQRMNNNESAISNYQSAITAYQKQINIGREADRAKIGIRFCRNGIRACGS